jgi:hypothetical protein
VDIVYWQEAQRERGQIGISLSEDKIRNRHRVWIAMWKGIGLVANEQRDLSRRANDVIATDIRRRCKNLTNIANIYDQKDMQLGERLRPSRKLNWQRVSRQGGSVHAGDMNAHSKRWDSRCQMHQNAVFWKGVIDQNRLEIGNDGSPTHYDTTEDQEGESVIDLKLANRPIVMCTILADDHATGSDHEVIK